MSNLPSNSDRPPAHDLCRRARVVYTFVITGISQVAFNSNANGSLVTVNGKVVGST